MTDLPRPDDWDEPVVVPDLPPMARILVPFDGSHYAERALAWAKQLARSADAEVVVMVAYEPPLTKRGRGTAYVEEMRDRLEEEATTLATEAVEVLEAGGCSARGVVVRGDPAAAALDVAESEHVDLVVMGRRGLTAELSGLGGSLERFRSSLSGGVTERVARHADAPVMVV